MTPTKAKARIVKTIAQIQENSGREVPEKITGRMKPIGDLVGFDSLNGLELSVLLSTEFGTDPQENLCISEDGRRALTVNEMVARGCGTSIREG
jgi:acyl carrier protein